MPLRPLRSFIQKRRSAPPTEHRPLSTLASVIATQLSANRLAPGKSLVLATLAASHSNRDGGCTAVSSGRNGVIRRSGMGWIEGASRPSTTALHRFSMAVHARAA